MSDIKHTTQVKNYLQQFFATKQDEFSVLRALAADNLKLYGFPTAKTEAWKYTNVKSLLKAYYEPIEQEIIVNEQQIHQYFVEDALRIVFVNGFYNETLSNFRSGDAIVSSLANNLDIGKYFAKFVKEKPGFDVLNTLFFKKACFLSIQDKLTKPIHVLHVASGVEQQQMVLDKMFIMLEKNTKADIIEQYISIEGENYWRNSVSEIVIKQDANLNYYKLQQEPYSAKHTASMHVQQYKDSIFNSINLDLGGKLVRNDLRVDLIESGAFCHLNGLYLTKQGQHVDNHTEVEHASAHTYSQEYYKGVLDAKSRAVFNGRVLVQKEAQKIESAQKNANLLLSSDAEIDTKPELEIYADDVKCSHGATVGQLDKKAIFYLQSRGIEESDAKKLLTYGFAYEIVEIIENNNIRNFFTKHLLAWFSTDNFLNELVKWI